MKTVKTFYANIYCGLRAGYGETYYSTNDVNKVIEEYIAEFRDGVTVTRTTFKYVDGYEPGVIIGFINYPRSQRSESEIKNRAFLVANRLRKALRQERVSVVMPDQTVMFDKEDDNSEFSIDGKTPCQ